MSPASLPKIDNFISFNPERGFDGKCIYYLANERRLCKKSSSGSEETIRQLRSKIQRNPANSLDDLQEYARLNCCKQWHRSRIEDYGLAASLAQRWQAEILSTRDATPVEEDDLVEEQASSQLTTSTNTTSPISADNSMRYNFRSRTNTQQSSQSARSDISGVSSNPDFRPHLRTPGNDLGSKLWKQLGKKDMQSGILYLFNRVSSPGLVKIGVTCASIRSRFGRISRECHYTPELQYDFEDVPHVYRVETLVHFELLQHWRLEKRCRGCNRQHKEWFEVTVEYAIEVARQWVQWMKEATPYDRDGFLTMTWRDHLRQLQAEGTPVTASTLLQLHRMSLSNPVTFEDIVDETAVTSMESESNAGHIAQTAVAVLQIVLAHMEHMQIQQALQRTYRGFHRSTDMTSQSSTTSSFTSGDLLRRDTNVSVASQA